MDHDDIPILGLSTWQCVSRRAAATKMDRTCKAKCKCKGVDAYAPLGVRFEQTRDTFIPRWGGPEYLPLS